MFISALTVMMSNPPAAWVNRYFDEFNANAAHLWQTGLPFEVQDWAAAGNPNFRWLSWVDEHGRSSANLEFLGGLTQIPPGRIGYQLWDEPMNWEEFAALRTAYDMLRDADPEALIIQNFTWHNVSDREKMVDAFLGDWDGDIVSYDSYTLSNRAYERLAAFRSQALDHRKPYWRYMRAYYDSPSASAVTPSDLRWDVMSGAVHGYTGHSWFLYQIDANPELLPAFFTNLGDYSSPVTPLWTAAAQLNREMTHIGRSLVLLTSTDVRYQASGVLFQPKGTIAWSTGAGNDPFLTALAPAPGNNFLEHLIGFFVDDSAEVYVMLQNVRHESGEWPINNDHPGTLRMDFDFTGAPTNVSRTAILRLDQGTGNVVDVPLSALGADLSRLEVTLDAGDVFFFKYKTGLPFVMQP